jgi:hypothetical protein
MYSLILAVYAAERRGIHPQGLKQESELHHDKHHLGSRHNRRHPNVEKFAEKVNLDYGE